MNHADSLIPLLLLAATWIAGVLAKAVRKPGPAPGPGAAPAADDEERVRRVREEVRRTIVERRPASPVLAPRPVAGPLGGGDFPLGEALRRMISGDEFSDGEAARDEEEAPPILTVPAVASVPVVSAPAPLPLPTAPTDAYGPAAGSAAAREIRAQMRTASGARRAMILREVLGPPIALRS